MRVVGITSGASAPEELVQRLVEFFRARGTSDVQELEVVQEDVRFMLPKAIRQALATALGRAPPPAHAGRLGPAPRRADRGRRAARGPSRARRCWRRSRGATGSCCSATRSSFATARCATRSRRPSRCSRELAGALGAGGRGRDRAGQPRPPPAARLARAARRTARAAAARARRPRSTGASGSRWRRSPGWFAPATVRARYPGVWLRDDVYATHGHYGDRHTTVPILERLGAGLMARVGRERDGGPAQRRGLRGGARADVRLDRRGRAERRRARRAAAAASRCGPGARSRAPGAGGRPRPAGVAVAFPVGGRRAQPGRARAAPRRRLGRRAAPRRAAGVRARCSRGWACRRRARDLRATPTAPGRCPATTRSSGPRAGGAAMLNTGCWVYERGFLGDDPQRSPYRPGSARSSKTSAPAPRAASTLLDPA